MQTHHWCSIIALSLTSTFRASSAQQVKPLTIADAIATRSFMSLSPMSLSPDGEWVAYTITNPSKLRTHTDDALEYMRTGAPRAAEGAELWIANTRTGEMRDLSGPAGGSWDGVWSPNGAHLAFYSDRDGLEHLWVWDRKTATIRRVSDVIAHPFFAHEAPQWTPDGTALLLKVLSEGETIEGTPDSLAQAPRTLPNDSTPTATVLTANLGPADTSRGIAVASQRLHADLALVSLSNGAVRRIVRRASVMRYWLSPTGRRIAFTTATGVVQSPEIANVFDVSVADVSTGRIRTVASRVLHWWGPPVSWSPDGERLAFTTKPYSFEIEDRPDHALPTGDCYIVNVAAGKTRLMTPGRHADFSDDLNPPMWSADGSTLYALGSDTLWRIDVKRLNIEAVGTVAGRRSVAIIASGPNARPWSPNGRPEIMVRTLDTATLKVGIARIDPCSGSAHMLYEDDEWLPVSDRVAFGMAAVGDVLVYEREDVSHPDDIWVTSSTFGDRRRLTHINPQLDAYVFGERRLIYWQSDDGDSLRGALLLPAGYRPGTRYPLISWQYGGENWSRLANGFGIISFEIDYLQLLATRGYAVLVPDAPQHTGTPMLDLAKTVLPGVNRAIELGIADPARLGIMGQSYGCASTLMLVVQTTRFKAAECSSGFSSIIGMAGTIGSGATWAESGQGKMGATVWERRDRYIENSPYFYLDRVTTPLLLVMGTSDRAVPPFLGDATFAALRQLGKRVEYVRYGGEGHQPMKYSAANQADWMQRVVRWFDTYLGTESPVVSH
jgi:dipeptidyl aminopeptidase/acylaminoacyl peptidase